MNLCDLSPVSSKFIAEVINESIMTKTSQLSQTTDLMNTIEFIRPDSNININININIMKPSMTDSNQNLGIMNPLTTEYIPQTTTNLKTFELIMKDSMNTQRPDFKRLIKQKLSHFRLTKLRKKKIKAFFRSFIENSKTAGITTEETKDVATKLNQENISKSLKSVASKNEENFHFCDVCLTEKSHDMFIDWIQCHHKICIPCGINYIHEQIMCLSNHQICCHLCDSKLHQNEVKDVINFQNKYDTETLQIIQTDNTIPDICYRNLYKRYVKMTLERTLILIPNIRFCPGEDCEYAVIADNCKDCPKLKCENKKCGINFCYHCKSKWHSNQSCNEDLTNRLTQNMEIWSIDDLKLVYQLHHDIMKKFETNDSTNSMKDCIPWELHDDMKLCPKCKCAVVKENDGKCNLVLCNMCNTLFCWLCLQPATDSHYFGTNGCTYFGRKKWSARKTLAWRIALMVGGPIWIASFAILLIPTTLFTIPPYIAHSIHKKLKLQKPTILKSLATITTFLFSFIFSPILYVLIVTVGVPAALYHIYYRTPINIFLRKNNPKTQKYEHAVQRKLTLTNSQTQLFLNHSKWIILELAKKSDQLDQKSHKSILSLVKLSFQNQLDGFDHNSFHKISLDFKESISNRSSSALHNKSFSTSNPESSQPHLNNKQIQKYNNFSFIQTKFKHSRANSL